MDEPRWIDEFERDFGIAARDRLTDRVGGQTRYIPVIASAGNSRLAGEIGSEAARWLSYRFGGGEISFPSRGGELHRNRKSLLEADILEAGLINPTRTVNDLAQAHGVTSRWVQIVRAELMAETSKTEHFTETKYQDT